MNSVNNSISSQIIVPKRSYCFSRNPILSEARRSFLLITIFDFSFIVLLWLIYCTTKGYSLKEAYDKEIVNYNIDQSLFDVVVLSLLRLFLLSLIYVFIRLIHWLPVAFITFTSSSFLISKVVLFAINATHNVITDYLILIISFVIAWIQVWYLEVKIFSPERTPYIQQIDSEQQRPSSTTQTPIINNNNNGNMNFERGYGSLNRRAVSDIGSFYSPLDSPNESENEENTGILKRPPPNQLLVTQTSLLPDFSNLSVSSQAKEYELLARDVINKVVEIFNKKDGWKSEKEVRPETLSINDSDDSSETRITSQSFSKIGKVFKLESVLKFNYQIVINVLRDLDKFAEWNKSVKATKLLHRYSDNLMVIYSSVHDQVGGLVASRDFVNLSSYCKMNNLHILAGSACVHASMPPQEGFVRGENGPTAYILNPIDNTTCQITWLLNVNLKGWLPQYLIDQSLSGVQVDFINSLTDYLKVYN